MSRCCCSVWPTEDLEALELVKSRTDGQERKVTATTIGGKDEGMIFMIDLVS